MEGSFEFFDDSNIIEWSSVVFLEMVQEQLCMHVKI
jgi:hypothetical protein